MIRRKFFSFSSVYDWGASALSFLDCELRKLLPYIFWWKIKNVKVLKNPIASFLNLHTTTI